MSKKCFKILIVEDDEFFREILMNVLETKYSVSQVPNGLMAKEVLMLDESFDLIISDIQMPFFTGIELLQWVKSDLHLKAKIPMILVTGFSQILETKNASNLGADDFLSKPFSARDLIEKIERFATPKVTSIERQF
jgi:CheY-like chemotaxis protein